MCSSLDSLHACASVSPVEKMSKETEEVEEERSRGLVKRGPPFCTGGNRVAQPRETRACSELRTGYRGHVYCTDRPPYSVPVYCPTCLGTKGLKRTLVHVRVRSTVPVYALQVLYLGFWLLSYVARKLQLLRNQSVLYVQKSVRNL
jgi:hypothetical protein